ncbi:GBP1-like protein, partial [Mya arenaria]
AKAVNKNISLLGTLPTHRPKEYGSCADRILLKKGRSLFFSIRKESMIQRRFLKVVRSNVTVAKGESEDDSFLDFFFPNLVLVLRDFALQSDISKEVFLEQRLMYKNGKLDGANKFNEPRRLIRRYFKKRTCFGIPIPCTRPDQLESMPDSKIESEFLQQINDLHQYLCECSPKKLISGKPVNGRMLRTMIISYMNSVKENTAPCLQDAMKLMADEENQFAVRKASEWYQEEMKKRINKHMPNESGLERYHNDCMKVAVKKLRELVVVDDGDIFNRKAAECFEKHLELFKSMVEKYSLERSRRSIEILDMEIQRKIKEKKYANPHGYNEYFEDINNLVDEFTKREDYHGSKARAVLQEYMDSKVDEEQLVYEMVKGETDDEVQRQSHQLPRTLEQFPNINPKEESVKKKALESIEKFENHGFMRIGSQYIENLELKLQEIEKAKAELSEDNTYYKQLVDEYNVWLDIYKKANFSVDQANPRPIQMPKPVLTDTPVVEKPSENPDGKKPKPKKQPSGKPKCPII